MKTILIIEDSEQNLYLTRFILEQHGYQVLAAPDGPTGIASALEHRPTLILLDIQLPGMDGYEVARHLRSHAELRATPIVAVTSYAMTGDRERVMAAGCTGYLEKPINPETFASDIHGFLAAPKQPAPRRILVVDDLEANRELLGTLFRAHGWTVSWAGNGSEALAQAHRESPDLVISDILMPGMDGFTLCCEWRKDPALKRIPFVFYSATYTDDQDQRFGLSLGADAFLLKPLEPEALMDRLRDVFASQSGSERTVPQPAQDETATLRQYNAILVRKLEEKMLQVEALNRDLEARVRERTRELQVANDKLQAFGQIGTWISELEPEQTLQWSDETCRIFGIRPESFDGRTETFFRLVHPDDLESVRTASREVWSGRRRLNLQHRIVRPDGELHWVHQEAELVRDAQGRALRLVGVIREITDYRLLEEQLRQSQKMEAIGQMAGAVAHDFNNALTIIQGHSNLIGSYPGLPQGALDSLRQVDAATEMAARLTRQLLAFSRRQPPQLIEVDLNEVVRGMIRMVGTLVGKNTVLEEVLAPHLPRVLADASMLEQVVMNLVVNARDAMPEGGRLTLRTNMVNLDDATSVRMGCPASGRHVTLAVTDTGTGIESRHLPFLFEPFFTTKADGRGTGLGLAVAYGIAHQHRGLITVQTRVGSGSTFTLYLPAV